jgi:hypothetical protein
MDFSPKSIDDFVGNSTIVEELKKWTSDVKKDPFYPKRICFITGSNSTGKSILSKLVLEKEGFTIREFSSSNLRIKQERELLYQALCFKDVLSMGKNNFRKAIIIDDFENMCLATTEVFKKVKDLVKNKKSIGIPILFIGNKYFKGKRPLIGTSVYFRLSPRTIKNMYTIIQHILKILKNKNIHLEINKDDQLNICKKSGGDIRKIIYYFERISDTTMDNTEKMNNQIDSQIIMEKHNITGPLYSLNRIIHHNNDITMKEILNELSIDSSLSYGIYHSYINYIPWIMKNNVFQKERCFTLWKQISELFSIYSSLKDYEKSNQKWEYFEIANIISCWGFRCLIKNELNTKLKNELNTKLNKPSYKGKHFWWVELEKGKRTGDEPIDIPICNKLLRGHFNTNMLSNTTFKMIESGIGNNIAWSPKNIRGTLQILKLNINTNNIMNKNMFERLVKIVGIL